MTKTHWTIIIIIFMAFGVREMQRQKIPIAPNLQADFHPRYLVPADSFYAGEVAQAWELNR